MYDKIFFSSYKELLEQARTMDDPVLAGVKGLLIDGYTKKVVLSGQERKEIVDELFDGIAEGMIEKELSNDLSAGPSFRRRKEALISVMDKAVGLFADAYPDVICLEHNLAELETTPAPGTYASLNYKAHVDTAVALWILDDLKRNGKIAEASKYLPKTYDELFTVDIPANFYDPCFDEDLVRSMVYTVRNRNMGDFDDRDSYGNAFADDVTAAGRHKRTAFLKCFRKIRVHVAGNCLDVLHPLLPDELDEVVDDTFLLPFGNEENMTGFELYDMSGKLAIIVEFELVNTKVFYCLFRFSELLAIEGVFVEQSL